MERLDTSSSVIDARQMERRVIESEVRTSLQYHARATSG
jgi:hypothetical protein